MKLISLKLTNFQGGNDTIEPNGQNVNILGYNRTGKTRLKSADNWLKTGKNAFDQQPSGKGAFSILPLDEHGKRIIDITKCSVEEVFETDDGIRITLMKTFEEKWTKPRKSLYLVHESNTIGHFINGKTVSLGDWDDAIDELCGRESAAKVLTDPLYFSKHMEWQDRRALAFRVVPSSITDADVIATNKELAELPIILNGSTPEAHRKMANSKLAPIVKEVAGIEPVIKEKRREISELGNQADRDAIEAGLKGLRVTLREKEHNLTMIETGGEVAEKELELREVQGQIADLEREQYNRNNDAVQALNAEVSELTRKYGEDEAKVNTITSRIAENEAKLARNIEKGKGIKVSLEETRDKVWTGETVCPTCKQDLPDDQIEETKNNFNQNKAEMIEKIEAELTTLRTEWADFTAQIKADKALLETSASEDYKAKIEELQGKIAEHKQKAAIENPDWPVLTGEIIAIQLKIADLKEGKADRTEPLQAEIAAIGGQISENESKLAAFTSTESATKRIEELKAREKELNAEHEGLLREIHLCNLFITIKAELMAEPLNKHFAPVSFKLVDTPLKGEPTECFETIGADGRPFNGGLNKAGQVQAGAHIIKRLQEHEGVHLPMWIDDSEGIFDLPEMDCQIIRLVASKADKVLRMEVA